MRSISLVVTTGSDEWFVTEPEGKHGPYKRYEALGLAAAKAMKAVENGAQSAEVLLEHSDGRRTVFLRHQPQSKPQSAS